MRNALLAVLTLALPAAVAAQSRVPAPGVTGPLPSIGLPLPRITPTLPPIGIAPAREAHAAPRPVPPGGNAGHRPAAVIFFPYYLWNGYRSHPAAGRPGYVDPPDESRTADPATGTLELAVQPRDLVQIYIDGFFAGMPSDFNGDLALEAGTHRIELRAPGYRTMSFDVRIVAGRSMTYRGSLEPLTASPSEPAAGAASPVPDPATAAAPPAPSPRRTTIYLIPGCYLGNVPPEQARLSPACDVSKVTTFEP